jgi:hypothetical protein
LTKLIKDGDWKGRKPADGDIIDLVISKSMWYSHHKRLFSRLSQYPNMQKWLRGDDGAPSDYEIWGKEKGTYQWGDLALWLEERRKKSLKKGKGKQGKEKEGKKKKKDESEEEDKSKKSKKKRN